MKLLVLTALVLVAGAQAHADEGCKGFCLSYEYKETSNLFKTCSTGQHLFDAADQSVTMIEFCATLESKMLNNNCALSDRAKAYGESGCVNITGKFEEK